MIVYKGKLLKKSSNRKSKHVRSAAPWQVCATSAESSHMRETTAAPSVPVPPPRRRPTRAGPCPRRYVMGLPARGGPGLVSSGAAQTNRCCSSHEKQTAIKPRASRNREFLYQ